MSQETVEWTWGEIAFWTLAFSLLLVLIAGWLTVALLWRGIL